MNFIVKNTTLPGLLDLLAPHSCRGCGRIGEPVCNRCKNYIISEHKTFQADLPKGLPPTYVVSNRDGLMGTLVHDLKYKSVRSLTKPIAEILDRTLPKFGGKVVIVPLPTISRHVRERGIDHTYQIARYFAKIRGYKVEKLLARARNTVQVGSSRGQRLKQAEKAYQIKSNAKIEKDTTYILLDDVWTTGATMKAAVKQMKTVKANKLILAILAIS